MAVPSTSAVADRLRGLPRPRVGVVLLGLVAYVPLLLTRPGQVGADTKTYLYLDPGRLLSRAAHLWDPNIGLGTVTHQNIGYLWPMGPYYWLMEALAVPDWAAQRLWLGSIILFAGLGVRFMLKELRWVGAGVTVASFAYALSPYLVDYAARISVILLPFAGLPWLIGLAARSLRLQDWRAPAAFALVTLTVGGVNATSLVLVMVAPVLWLAYSVWVERSATLRSALAAGGRITALTAATSLWWIAGLAIQGAYGIPILRYTETYETVAGASLSTELMRGLGYWFFYGTDGLGPWTDASLTYVEHLPSLALSFALPGLAIAAVLLTRWRHRTYFAVVVLVGLVLSVGSHPWDSPSPYGALFQAFTRSDLGLSLRSTPRAVPLIALGSAVFLGAGVAAVTRARPRWHLSVSSVALVAVVANMSPLWQGQMVDRYLVRDEQVPSYWVDAAAALDAGDRSTRVWELPGIDFASYRWGNTVDPISPGLMDREMFARELIPYGTPASANLVNDTDLPFQSERVEPDAIAPLARMMGVGEVVLRADLQYERYRTPRPRNTYSQLLAAPGLGAPVGFGPVAPNVAGPELLLDDETEFAVPLDVPDPAPVTVFPVEDPRAILRTVGASAPTVVAGDAAGLVTLAALRALAVDRPVFYAASSADEPDHLRSLAAEPDATLVVTDTNRRQARRWGGVRDNDGLTERSGELPLDARAAQARLDVFPDADDDAYTVVEQLGGASVSATAYGNGVSFSAGDRPANAFDGDLDTAWRVGAFDDPVGEFLRLSVDDPVTTDRVTLVQVQGPKNRHLTEVSLRFDDGDPITVVLDDRSRAAPGQIVDLPTTTFSQLDVTVEATDRDGLGTYRGVSDVGFAEIDLAGVEKVTEVIRPPVDLLDTLGPTSVERELLYAFSRRAATATEGFVSDEEPTLRRWVEGPVDRRFTVFGRARLSPDLSDDAVDTLLGLPGPAEGGARATSTARLGGDLRSRASAAVDGDPTTAWRSPVNEPAGATLELTYGTEQTVDGLALQVVDDGRHSLPRVLSISTDGGEPQRLTLDVEALSGGAPRGTTRIIDVPVGELVGTTFTVRIDEVVEAGSRDWFAQAPITLPVAIVDLGLPTVPTPDPDAIVDLGCRDDLLVVDGSPAPVRVTGTVAEAESGDSLAVHGCGDSEEGVELPAGRTLLETTPGADTGVDVDMVALSSAPGGGPGVDTMAEPLPAGPAGPDTTTERTSRNGHRVEVTGAEAPYWVVLGQSHSDGFRATTSDGVDLGRSVLVNGHANGWRVDPADLGTDLVIDIAWTPQRAVWIGLVLSALGVLACLGLLWWPGRRRPPEECWSATMEPVGAGPAQVDGPPRPPIVAGWLVAGSALVTLAVVGPVAAIAVAVITAVGMLVPRGQLVLRLGSLVLSGAAFGYVVLKQFRNDYPLDFNWVRWFETTHQWTLVAVVLMVVSVLVDDLRAQRRG